MAAADGEGDVYADAAANGLADGAADGAALTAAWRCGVVQPRTHAALKLRLGLVIVLLQ